MPASSPSSSSFEFELVLLHLALIRCRCCCPLPAHSPSIPHPACRRTAGTIVYAGARYRAISKFALVVLRERNPMRQVRPKPRSASERLG